MATDLRSKGPRQGSQKPAVLLAKPDLDTKWCSARVWFGMGPRRVCSSIIAGTGTLTTGIRTNWPPLRLPRQRVEEIQAETAVTAQNPLVGLIAEAKLLTMGGHFSHAYKLLRLLESEHGVADGDRENLGRLWPAAILAHAPDIAVSLVQQRFRLSCQIEIEIGPALPVDVAIMDVHGDNLRFELSPALFEFFAVEMVLNRLLSMFPLWDAFMRSPDRIDGTVAVNLLDDGSGQVWRSANIGRDTT